MRILESQKNAQAYATLIEGMDKSLGDILDHLESLGIAENTLVLFVGDNGSDAPLGPVHEHASSFPLRAKKGTHYEGGMRVPFIASWAKPSKKNQFQKRPAHSGRRHPGATWNGDGYLPDCAFRGGNSTTIRPCA